MEIGRISIWAKLYVAATIIAGLALVLLAVPLWTAHETGRYVLYLIGAFLAANLKVSLPGITGTMSVNFVFNLISVIDLNLPQMLTISYAGNVGQLFWRAKAWHPLQVAFNLSSITIATFCCYSVYHSTLIRSLDSSIPLLLLFASAALFFANTLSVAGIIALTEGKAFWRVWHDNFLWTASHHLVGAGLAAVVHLEDRYFGWQACVLTVPAIYFVYRSYSLHLGRLEEAKRHVREMGELHWRTIEALALAIDAKDETTHNHLLRVRVYATEVGKELNLGEIEMQAIHAASLLHDIGKLAVPEYIISKPGKLTPDEFEKMKVHPVVGAEILEQVRFPYPVVPIVRSHHEKWNGMGYPEGLRGDEIPIGARILSAVDCLDALASDRQYRRAMPLEKAMEIVIAESGKSFDPRIVDILKRRYVELEKKATALPCAEGPKLSKNVKFKAGDAPASGFEQSGPAAMAQGTVQSSLASLAVRNAMNDLLDLPEHSANFSPVELLSILAGRLQHVVPHDSIAVYVWRAEEMLPVFTRGLDSALFESLRIPIGQGLSGWVAENRKPIVNGNPAVEPGYLNDPGQRTTLRSALSIPLEQANSAIGALTLYSANADHFTKGQLELILAVGAKVSAILSKTPRQPALPEPAPAPEKCLISSELPSARIAPHAEAAVTIH